MRRTAIAALVLAFSAVPRLHAQNSVTVRVIDDASGTALADAWVELADHERGVTGSDGRYVFRQVETRRYTLRAGAFGYETHERVIDASRDVTVEVRLRVRAVPLDTIAAQARLIRIRGEVVGSDSRRGVPGAEVIVGAAITATNSVGAFRIRVPVDVAVEVQVLGAGYLPYRDSVRVAGDTLLRVTLQPDPVAARMIEQQLARLERRVRGVPYAVRRLDRAAVLRHGGASTAYDVLRLNGIEPTPGTIGCLLIDDAPAPGGERFVSAGGGFRGRMEAERLRSILNTYTPEEIERVEYVPRMAMVRIYTFRYVRSRLAGRSTLIPVMAGICQ